MLRLCVGEVEDPLRPERIGVCRLTSQCRCGPGNVQPRPLGDIEADAVRGGPEIGGAPELREGLMQALRAPVGLEGRVLEILQHDAVTAALPIPALRVVRRPADVVPHGLRRCGAALLRHRVVHDDIAVLVPEPQVLGRQHWLARLDRIERMLRLGR